MVRHGYQHPEGKVFILCNTDEYENHSLRSQFKPEKIIYQSLDYVILGYDDYENMIDDLYPGYDFAGNKGYGTAKHYEGLRSLGYTPIHRRSFLRKFEE